MFQRSIGFNPEVVRYQLLNACMPIGRLESLNRCSEHTSYIWAKSVLNHAGDDFHPCQQDLECILLDFGRMFKMTPKSTLVDVELPGACLGWIQFQRTQVLKSVKDRLDD